MNKGDQQSPMLQKREMVSTEWNQILTSEHLRPNKRNGRMFIKTEEIIKKIEELRNERKMQETNVTLVCLSKEKSQVNSWRRKQNSSSDILGWSPEMIHTRRARETTVRRLMANVSMCTEHQGETESVGIEKAYP